MTPINTHDMEKINIIQTVIASGYQALNQSVIQLNVDFKMNQFRNINFVIILIMIK